MTKIKFLMVSGILASLSFASLADDQVVNKIKLKMQSVLGANVTSVTKSPVAGFYEVLTPRGLFYASADGRYLMQGSIYDLDNDLKNITEQKMATVRKVKLETYTDSMIVFPAKNAKHTVTVFTDVDCCYWQKLHANMAQYIALGITVRYMAFPRGGPRSPAWGKMQSLWCSDDQHKAMDDLKAGSAIAKASCDNKVGEHYQLGIEFGVTGTPAIILDDGSLIPGFKPPAQLLAALKASS